MPETPGDRDDWMKYANLTEEERRFLQRKSRKKPSQSRVTFAVLLIVAGVFTFLSNLGIFPIHDVWIYWPLFPIIGGITRLSSSDNASGRAWGVLMLVVGILFLPLNLGLIHVRTNGDSWIFSLVLIAVGFVALLGVLESSGKLTLQRPSGRVAPRAEPVNENTVVHFVVFGAVKRRLESYAFEGGELTSVFGNIEIDLRKSVIAPGEKRAVLDVTAVFGSVHIRVPEYWRVHVSGSSILGNFEDKTIPPNLGLDAPTLIVDGLSIFGSVEIED